LKRQASVIHHTIQEQDLVSWSGHCFRYSFSSLFVVSPLKLVKSQLPRLLPSSFFDGIDFEQRTAGARRRERNSGPARSVRAAADSKDFCTHFYTLRTGGMRESMIRDKMNDFICPKLSEIRNAVIKNVPLLSKVV
jgi:hypothetical protein